MLFLATLTAPEQAPECRTANQASRADIAELVHAAGATTSSAVARAAGSSAGATPAIAPCASVATSMCGPGPVAPRGDARSQTDCAWCCEISCLVSINGPSRSLTQQESKDFAPHH